MNLQLPMPITHIEISATKGEQLHVEAFAGSQRKDDYLTANLDKLPKRTEAWMRAMVPVVTQESAAAKCICDVDCDEFCLAHPNEPHYAPFEPNSVYDRLEHYEKEVARLQRARIADSERIGAMMCSVYSGVDGSQPEGEDGSLDVHTTPDLSIDFETLFEDANRRHHHRDY